MQNTIERRGLLLCIVGPAGSGKTSLSASLCEQIKPELNVSVSVTTRKPRKGEVEGQSYFFVSDQQFDELVEQREFVEWEQVHGFRYGTLRSILSNAIEHGHDLLLRIDIRGADNLKRLYNRDTVVVFLVPPHFDVLKERLDARGKIQSDELKRRLQTANYELNLLIEKLDSGLIDYVLVNEKFDESVQALLSIVRSERMRAQRVFADSLRKLTADLESINS